MAAVLVILSLTSKINTCWVYFSYQSDKKKHIAREKFAVRSLAKLYCPLLACTNPLRIEPKIFKKYGVVVQAKHIIICQIKHVNENKKIYLPSLFSYKVR